MLSSFYPVSLKTYKFRWEKTHHIFSKQQKHSLHLKHTFLKNHPDVPCSLVKNGYLLCGDFSNCPKVFPFQKTAPRNLWWWWPRLILLAGCWWPPMFGGWKKASRLWISWESSFFARIGCQQMGAQNNLVFSYTKMTSFIQKDPRWKKPLSSRLG